MKRNLRVLLILLCMALLLALPALGAKDITVYVTVVDNGALFTGQSGEPIVAVPVTVRKGSTMDDVLRALHEKECAAGASGYGSTSMEFYGTKTTYMTQFFGKNVDAMTDGSAYAVSSWVNNNSNTTLTSKVRDGDRVDVQIYTVVSAMKFSYANYGVTWLDYYAADAGIGEEITVGAWRSEMDLSTFQWLTKPATELNVLVNGVKSGFTVGADGMLKLKFDEAGIYYILVGNNASYGSTAMKLTVAAGKTFTGYAPLGPDRMAASGLEDLEATGETVTVYATAVDNGSYLTGESSGTPLVHYPLTLPKGATLDDALNALCASECSAGEEGYASSYMEMGGQTTYFLSKFFGQTADLTNGSRTAASAWVNHDGTSTLATVLEDGDLVDVIRYTVVDSMMYSFENYGISYFDYPAAEAAPGEAVTLQTYSSELNFMSYKYLDKPLGGLTLTVNGEPSDFSVDASGAVTVCFDEPGDYYLVAGGDKTHAAAAMKLTIAEGGSFANSSSAIDTDALLKANLAASGNGSGAPITVYVTVTDKGSYVRSEVDGEYLIAVPVTVPGGSTLDDVLQALHAQETTTGAMGYSSYSMDFYGSPYYSVGTWFGKPVNSFDGSNYAVAAWVGHDGSSTLQTKVQDGDTVNAIVYSVVSSMEQKYQYWGIGYFDLPQATAGVGEEITLHAYHTVLDMNSYQWNNYSSGGLKVFVNGAPRSETVGSDGTLKLTFDAPGTYYILANGNEGYAAAAAKITVEQGASFADNAPVAVENVQTEAAGKADLKPILRIVGIVLVVILVAVATVRAVKQQKKEDREDAE